MKCILSRRLNLTAPGVFALGLAVALAAVSLDAQVIRPGGPVRPAATPPGAAPGPVVAADLEIPFNDEGLPSLKFDNAPLDFLLLAYSQVTGRTLLRSPGLPSANITLRSQEPLSVDEYLLALETVLSLHGVALLPQDESFVKVVPLKDVRRLGIRTDLVEPEVPHVETGQLVSQMIELKHVVISEIKGALDGLRRSEGQIQLFERTNSILVTDTADNVNRMMEIIRYIDQPVVQREEANVRQIRFAKATEIKRRLEEIIADARKEQAKAPTEVPAARRAGSPGIETRTVEPPTVPGVIRPRRPQPVEDTIADAEISDIIESLISEAERGVIRGRVHIVADDRTNILIIITRPENMTFFDRIISVLDIETAPDVLVEVMRLEYAVADEVAKMLNDLIGQQSDAVPRTVGDPDAATDADAPTDRSARLDEFVDRLRRDTTGESLSDEARSRVGELRRDSIKILANERTNALIIMASQSDLATLKEIIRDMDIMLSQVLIETVILEVNLEDRLETGVDWVQRAMVAYTGDGREAQAAFATRGGGGTLRPIDPLTRTTAASFGDPSSGISHYLTFFGLNLDLVVRATKSDSRARILSSPVILTQDNKEATIEATTRRYFLKGTRYITTAANQVETVDDVEQRDIGITLKVTPRINAHGFVVMNVEQAIENIIGTQRINEGDWPIVSSRRLGADIAVSSGETVVLGGLVLNNERKAQSRVPFLGRIPLLGFLFRSTSVEESRSEVVVFLTPYVLDTPAELLAEARRRKESISAGDMWQAGWSASRLASPQPGTPHPAVDADVPVPRPEIAPPTDTFPPLDPPAAAPSLPGSSPVSPQDERPDGIPLPDAPPPEADMEIEAAVRRAFGN